MVILGPSFSTIAGYGPNGAIIHYHPEEDSAHPLDLDSILLIDSGGQYFDGTTDVTRNLHIGSATLKLQKENAIDCQVSPTEHMKECYTLVLKGHIALATLIFPEGTTGARMDSLARIALWKYGEN